MSGALWRLKVNTEIKNTTEMLQEYIRYIQDDTQVKKIPTNFNRLDNLLNGGLPNGLITLGAIPSLGKTTFTLQLADNMAIMENTKVLFFSLEMSLFDLMSKSLSRLSFTNDDIENYTYDELLSNNEDIDYNNLFERYTPIANNLYIIDNTYNIDNIKNCIVEFRENNPNSNIVVVIDYLQYITCGNNGNDKQVIDMITKRLKELSKQLNLVIVAISSLNRANYSGNITMESFKESGSIEYTSDILIGLEYTNNNGIDRDMEARKNPRRITLNILKNRYGALGKINMDFNTTYSTFFEK